MNARQRRKALRAWLRAALSLLDVLPLYRWKDSPWTLSVAPLRVNVAGWCWRNPLLPRPPAWVVSCVVERTVQGWRAVGRAA